LGLSLTINIENVNSIKIAQIIGAIKTAQKIINKKIENLDSFFQSFLKSIYFAK
jgi:hypothetical protein